MEKCFVSGCEQQGHFFPKAFSLALCITHDFIKWLLEVIFTGVKRPELEASYFLPVPRL